MKLPHTVTIFQPSGPNSAYRRVAESTRGTVATKTALNSADSVTLHIPLPCELTLSPEKDHFARGDVPDEGYQKCREKHETYRVTSVSRYDYGLLQHLRWADDDLLFPESESAEKRTGKARRKG